MAAVRQATEGKDKEDLSEQQRHSVLVLAGTKELAKILYDLCPLHMNDKRWRCRFWMGTSYYRGGTCEVCGGVRHLQPGAQICFLMLCHEFFRSIYWTALRYC